MFLGTGFTPGVCKGGGGSGGSGGGIGFGKGYSKRGKFKGGKKGKKVAKGSAQLAKYSGILRDAAKYKGNFGLGKGTFSEALELGKAWVGKGYRVSGNGKAWISKDGLRQFRPPTHKPKLGIDQTNFQWRNVNRGGWQGNGHLDIIR